MAMESGLSRRCARFAPTAHGAEDRRDGIQIHRVAELVGARRAAGLDARRELARVVASRTAAAERSQQIAKRAIAEEVDRLVGDLEARFALRFTRRAQRLRLRLAGHRDVALLGQPLDDALDERF